MIKVNGEMLEIAEGTTVAAFLKEHGYPDKMIAVECNGCNYSEKYMGRSHFEGWRYS